MNDENDVGRSVGVRIAHKDVIVDTGSGTANCVWSDPVKFGLLSWGWRCGGGGLSGASHVADRVSGNAGAAKRK